MKKTIIYIISFFIFLVPLRCMASFDYEFVKDEAKLLKKDTIDYIDVYSNYLKNNLGIDYYVLTIHSLDDVTIEDYTDYIFEAGNLSDKSILIVISKEDRKLRVKVGGELSKIISNKTIDDYLNDYFVPYMKTEEWDLGIKNGYSAFFKLICNYYEIDSQVIEVYDGNSFINRNKSYILLFIVWMTSIFSYVYCSYMKKSYKNVKLISYKDNVVFMLCFIVNILLLFLAYYVMPISLLIVLLSEIILIYSDLSSWKSSRKGKIKRKK